MQPIFYRRLGAYFNDAGVNMMHDDWFSPVAKETAAFFQVSRDEAPDYIVSLHSHDSTPSIEQTSYVPRTVKRTIKELADVVYRRYASVGLPSRGQGVEPKEDGEKFPPPSFNLSSALHHVCGGVSFVYESCTGVGDKRFPQVDHDQLLNIQMLFYEELFRYAVANPVKWTRTGNA
jgi:hypothetical protein